MSGGALGEVARDAAWAGRDGRTSDFRRGPTPSSSPEGEGSSTRDSLRFAGYAAIFDLVDRGGDVIRRGAFGEVPAPAAAGGPGGVPLLWQHRGRPVGAIERIAVDARGLRVIGRIDAPPVAALVRAGALTGLSIGYRALGARTVSGGGRVGRVRELTALDLVEVSLVAAPMQRHARVHMVAGHAMGLFPDKVPDPRRPRADEE